jgi:hypothetical protein
MGVLLDLLTSEDFRRHPGMFVGSSQYREVAWWLRGFESAVEVEKALAGQRTGLQGFREWLQMTFKGAPTSTGRVSSAMSSEPAETRPRLGGNPV